MDFLDPKKKREHTIRLIIGYFLMATALGLASILFLFIAFGYGINRSTGEVIQNGLVFVDAHPEQATIYLNGKEKGKTDGRFVLEAGAYNAELKRDGYRNWKRDFVLDGGNIVRLVYPFMFPEKLVSNDIEAFAATPDLVTQSPDRKWIVAHDQTNPLNFRIMDTSLPVDEQQVVSISIPAPVLAGRSGAQKLELAEWSTDNRHVLLKNVYDGGYDYIVLDRQEPASSFNVTQVFGKAFGTVTLRDKKFDQLYLHDTATGQLISGNVKDKTTAAVAANVVAFWPYKANTLLYTTNDQAADLKSLLKIKDGAVTYTLKEIARSQKYLLNMAEFDGDTYIIGGANSDGKVYIYKNPLDQLKKSSTTKVNPTILLKLDNPQQLLFSGNARFASVQSGSKFAVYDFETKMQYKYDTKLDLPPAQNAAWMDGHRLMTVGNDGNMTVFDYDGLNPQTLVKASNAYLPLFDRDYNQLYTVGPLGSDAARQGLVRTDLNLGEE